MNNKLFGLFTFVAGAIVGSFVTGYYMSRKYEEYIDEEIENFKEDWTKTHEHNESSDNITDIPEKNEETPSTFKTQVKPNISDYVKIVTGNNYSNNIDYSGAFKKEKKGVAVPMMNKKRPYVISPNEFNELDGYEAISLNYYSDGVLTDDWDNVIENVDSLVGADFATHFGEYEDDSVFVRNEEIKKDFEILSDPRTFAAAVGKPLNTVE